jgi:hypothetical protein
MKYHLFQNLVRDVQPTGFLKITFQLIPEIRSLSADCIPKPPQRRRLGVSASQLLGRSVANFFHPLRSNVKHNQGLPVLKFGSGCVQPIGFLKITFQLISEILLPFRRLSAKPH